MTYQRHVHCFGFFSFNRMFTCVNINVFHFIRHVMLHNIHVTCLHGACDAAVMIVVCV